MERGKEFMCVRACVWFMIKTVKRKRKLKKEDEIHIHSHNTYKKIRKVVISGPFTFQLRLYGVISIISSQRNPTV